MNTLRSILKATFSKNRKIQNLMKFRDTFRKPKKQNVDFQNLRLFQSSPLRDPDRVLDTLHKLQNKNADLDLTDFVERVYADCLDNPENNRRLLHFITRHPKVLRNLPQNILLRVMQTHLDIIESHVKFEAQLVK